MSAVLTPPDRELIADPEHLWTMIQQLVGRDSGQADWGIPKDHTTVDDDTRYAHTIRNLGTGGALQVQSANGTNQMLVGEGGVTVGGLNTTGALGVGTDLSVNGNTVLGNNTAVDTVTMNAAVTAAGSLTVTGALTANGATTLGDAAGDTVTLTGNALANGSLTVNGTFSTTSTTNLGDGNADPITVIGVSTFRNAANTFTQLKVDGGNNRVLVGSGTALTGASSSVLEVTGLAYFTPSSAGEVALNVWRSPSAGSGWSIGVTSSDQLKFTDNGGQGIATIGDTSSTYQLEITGKGHITSTLTVDGGISNTAGSSAFTGGVSVITGGLSVLAGGITPHASSGTPAAGVLYTDNVPKAWGNVSGSTTTINGSFNVSSVGDLGGSGHRIIVDRAFANSNWAPIVTPLYVPGGTTATTVTVMLSIEDSDSCIIYCHRVSDGAHLDPTGYAFAFFGAQ